MLVAETIRVAMDALRVNNVRTMRDTTRRRSRVLGGILAVVSVCFGMSCSSDRALTTRAGAVKRGDPRTRALQLLGAPDDSQSEDDDEVLQYCKSRTAVISRDSSEYVLVWLYKGAVTGVATYRRALTASNSCASGFKAVHWEDAPDRVTEVRKP